MTTPTRPTNYPDWTSGTTLQVQTPPPSLQNVGWTAQKPPFVYWNWLQYYVGLWIRWLDYTTATVLSQAVNITASNAGHTVATGTNVQSQLDQLDSTVGAILGNVEVNDFSGDGTTTTFTLSESPGSLNATWVFISGVYQEKSTYSVSGASLIFSEAPPVGTNNIEVVISISAAAPVSGSGSIEWVESSNAPVASIDSTNNRVYAYGNGLGQNLYAVIKVPSSYGGSPIKMKMDFYSPDASGTVLMQTVSTLVRTGVDPYNDSANQRTSTNAAITLTISDILLSNTFDLTDSSGKINGITVSPGDLIYLKLTRGTDTATSAVQNLVYGVEMLYQ